MRKPTAGGGWRAIAYTLARAQGAGGAVRMWKALTAKNACKTCALGMGGQQGGMVNEAGRFPEVCKKSVQAMAADMQGAMREGFFREFGFDQLERFSNRELEHAGRLVEPLFAGPQDRTYRGISWEEAIKRVVSGLRESDPERTFFYFSGRSSNEAGFLLQLLARMYGTNNVNNCSYFCHQASGVGLASVTGSSAGTISLEDLDECDLVFLIGGNPASNHPRLMRTLMDLKRRSGRVVVVNPMREVGLVRFNVPSDPISLLAGTTIADEYVMPHIGGDIAFLTGLGKLVLGMGAEDRWFIDRHTEGFEAYERQVREIAWSAIEERSGVRREQIERVARMYVQSKGSVFAWTMGITHHEHGVDNVRAIANTAMLRGMLGRPGAGLLPLRGHSNVQGIGSVGAVPELKGAVARAIEARLGVTLPERRGMDTLASVRKAGQGHIDTAIHLGGNLYASCPDSRSAGASLSRIGLTVFMSTTLNSGHILGRGRASLILPVLTRDEEPQATTQESMFNFVRMSDGGEARYAGARSEVEVVAEIGRVVLGEAHPLMAATRRGNRAIRELIAEVIPGYGGLKGMDSTKREFSVAGRVFHTPAFATPSGRAVFHAVEPRELAGDGDELRMMTIRSEGQFNNIVYEESDIYRGQERRDVILLNGADMRARGLSEDDRVCVSSSCGRMDGLFAREADIREGNCAMYFPEANVLVPAMTDARSSTPAFKNIPVRVAKSGRLVVLAPGRS